jgi:hypothetical protein
MTPENQSQPQQPDWTRCVDALPPENVMVMTKIDDDKGVRNEQPLCFHSRLFWTGCGPDAIYVYYNPTHWRLQ